MSIVTITLSGKNFQLICSDEEKQDLLNLSNQLNQQITNLKNTNPTASFDLLIIMAALSLKEEVQVLRKKIAVDNNDGSRNNEEEFSSTLKTIASYLENLASKMSK